MRVRGNDDVGGGTGEISVCSEVVLDRERICLFNKSTGAVTNALNSVEGGQSWRGEGVGRHEKSFGKQKQWQRSREQ